MTIKYAAESVEMRTQKAGQITQRNRAIPPTPHTHVGLSLELCSHQPKQPIHNYASPPPLPFMSVCRWWPLPPHADLQ